MIKTFLFCALLILASQISLLKCQFCDISTIPEDPAKLPLPVPEKDAQYSALLEKNYDGRTSEITEYYDGIDNVGIIRIIDSGEIVSFYYYYKTNELLIVQGRTCAAYPLNTTAASINGGFQIVYINGQEHILSPLNALIGIPGFQVKYTGKNSTDRGIPVNQWVACLKSKDNRKTIRLTIAYSDPEKFTPASYMSLSQSERIVPIESIVETRDEQTGVVTTEIFSITRFRPFTPSLEEFYLPRSGVYCIDKKPGKEFPKLPQSFIYYAQAVPGLDGENQDEGVVSSVYVEYNAQYELYGRSFHVFNSTVFEVRDYQTGLEYDLTVQSSICKITNILSGDYYAQLNITYLDFNDPNQFFNFDDAQYQYVGMKRLEGILSVDVWVGKARINGFQLTIEWYFLSELWRRPDVKNYRTPIQLKVFFPEAKSNITFTYNIFGFRPTDYNLLGFDLNLCHPNMARKYFIFRLAKDLTDEVRSNEISFKEAVVKIIQEKARVTVMRVSRVEIAYDDEGVYVFFTLFERVKEYGPLATHSFKDDTPLNEAVKLLNSAFLRDEIQISYYSFIESTNLIIPVVTDSLKEIGPYEEGFVTITKQKNTKGFSEGVVAAVVIIVTLLGFVGGYFLIVLHNAKRITIPFVDRIFKL